MKYTDCIGTIDVQIYCQNDNDEEDDDNDIDDDDHHYGSRLGHHQQQKRQQKQHESKKEGVVALFEHMVEEEIVEVLDDDDGDDGDDNDNHDNYIPTRSSFNRSTDNGIGTCNSTDSCGNDILYLLMTDGIETYHGRIPMSTIKLLPSITQEKENNSFTTTMNKEQQMKIDLSNILLHPNKDITILYTQSCSNNSSSNSGSSSSTNDNFIKLVIKQSIRNIVSIVYSGELLPTNTLLHSHHFANNTNKCIPYKNSNSNNNNNNNNNDVMTFLKSITKSYNKTKSNLETIQSSKQTIQNQLHYWKDTAFKLQQKWQNEKDDTMSRYLILLNRIKRDSCTIKDELKIEKERYRLLEEKHKQLLHGNMTVSGNRTLSSSLSSSAAAAAVVSTSASFSRRNEVIDHEDEHDVEIFDDHVIDMLSQGKRVTDEVPSKKKVITRNIITNTGIGTDTTLSKNTSANASYTKSQSQSPASSTMTTTDISSLSMSSSSQLIPSSHPSQSSIPSSRSNPHTGVTEVWSIEEVLKDYNDNNNNSILKNNSSEDSNDGGNGNGNDNDNDLDNNSNHQRHSLSSHISSQTSQPKAPLKSLLKPSKHMKSRTLSKPPRRPPLKSSSTIPTTSVSLTSSSSVPIPSFSFSQERGKTKSSSLSQPQRKRKFTSSQMQDNASDNASDNDGGTTTTIATATAATTTAATTNVKVGLGGSPTKGSQSQSKSIDEIRRLRRERKKKRRVTMSSNDLEQL